MDHNSSKIVKNTQQRLQQQFFDKSDQEEVHSLLLRGGRKTCIHKKCHFRRIFAAAKLDHGIKNVKGNTLRGKAVEIDASSLSIQASGSSSQQIRLRGT